MENTSAPATNTVTVTTTVTYHPERIPPRCRKPRPVAETFVMTTEIPSVCGAQAPVAATFPEDLAPHGVSRPMAGIRTFGGKLYTSTGHSAQSQKFSNRTDNVWEDEKAAAERYISEPFASLLIIDGMVWDRINEPHYEITRYGFGNNHGGTGLSLKFPYRETELGAECFAVTEPEAAIEAALEAAAGRGDTNHFDRIRAVGQLNVLIPEAFKIQPQKARSAGKEAEVRAAADSLAALLKGSFNREMLREVRDRLRELDDTMLTQGIQRVGEQH